MKLLKAERDKQVWNVLLITFFLNLVVSGIKVVYGLITHSLSLKADGFHSLIDASSNIIGMIGIYLASQPPDEDHPYGHRKVEALASLGISFLLFMTGYEMIHSIINRILHPVMPQIDLWSFAIMAFTLLVNTFVATYEHKKAHQLHSEILQADSVHTRSDIYVSISVIFSFVAILLDWPMVDVAVAIGIGIFIIFVAYRVVLRSINILMDAQVLNPLEVEQLVSGIPGVTTCHKIRSRGTASGVFVDLHIHVDPESTTAQSHELSHTVINAIKAAYPQVLDVLVHTEPHHQHSELPH